MSLKFVYPSKIAQTLGLILCLFHGVPKVLSGQIPSPPGQIRSPSTKNTELTAATLMSPTYFTMNRQVNIDIDNQIAEAAPVIAVFGNHIYVVWNGDETVKSIFFSKVG